VPKFPSHTNRKCLDQSNLHFMLNEDSNTCVGQRNIQDESGVTTSGYTPDRYFKQKVYSAHNLTAVNTAAFSVSTCSATCSNPTQGTVGAYFMPQYIPTTRVSYLSELIPTVLR
jgi:hypothetical protein